MTDEFSSREIAEYDWVIFWGSEHTVLHAPAKFVDPDYHAFDDNGSTECGRFGRISIPGIFTRAEARRCKRCCLATGMPDGVGSPKNGTDVCRSVMHARWAKFMDSHEPNLTLEGL